MRTLQGSAEVVRGQLLRGVTLREMGEHQLKGWAGTSGPKLGLGSQLEDVAPPDPSLTERVREQFRGRVLSVY
jgi:hypothetical protein